MNTNFYHKLPLRVRIEQSKHLIEKCNDMLIHTINNLLIFKLTDNSFMVVNKDSLFSFLFLNESEALDYCLDRINKVVKLKSN